MSKSLSFATIAALLLGACVITDDDDDDTGNDTGSSPSTTNTSNTSTTASSATATTSDPTTDGTEDSTTAPADTGTSDPSETGTTGGGACGWGVTGEKTVPMGYICGGEGEDPDGLMPIGCPDGIELVEGGDCGGNMGIAGVGCCDAAGDVWYCTDDGSKTGPVLMTDDC